MDAVRNFAIQSSLSYRGLFFWLDSGSYISNVLLAPFLTLALFVLTGRFAGGEGVGDRFAVSMIAFGIVRLYTSGIGNAFSNDRRLGTLQFLLVSRQSRIEAYFAKGFGHYPNGPLAALCTVVLAALVLDFDVSQANVISCVLATLAICLAVLMMGMLVGNFALVMDDALLPTGLATGLLLTLTGVTIPVGSLPPGLYEVAQFLPITHGLQALRDGFAGAGPASVVQDVALETLVALLYAAVGAAMFLAVDHAARTRGILPS